MSVIGESVGEGNDTIRGKIHGEDSVWVMIFVRDDGEKERGLLSRRYGGGLGGWVMRSMQFLTVASICPGV